MNNWEAIERWWKTNAFARVLAGMLLVLAVAALVILATRAAIETTERYWPKKVPLTVDEAFQVGQFVILLVGLGSLILLWKQGRDGAKWNRLVTYHQYFDDLPAPAARDIMLTALKDVQAQTAIQGTGTALTDVQSSALTSDPDKYQSVKRYLDGFEQLCGAINCRVIDEEYTRALEKTRVLRIWKVYEPLILVEQVTNPESYVELEKVSKRWLELDEQEEVKRKKIEEKEQANKDKNRRNRGVKPAAP